MYNFGMKAFFELAEWLADWTITLVARVRCSTRSSSIMHVVLR